MLDMIARILLWKIHLLPRMHTKDSEFYTFNQSIVLLVSYSLQYVLRYHCLKWHEHVDEHWKRHWHRYRCSALSFCTHIALQLHSNTGLGQDFFAHAFGWVSGPGNVDLS